jgi:hypothetical protein
MKNIFIATQIITIEQFYRKLDRKRKIKTLFKNGRKN